MIWILLLPALFLVVILIPVCVVQILYLTAQRLRAKETEALTWFKEDFEDSLGYKPDEGALAFSIVKHSLVVLLTLLIAAVTYAPEKNLWRTVAETFAVSWSLMMIVSHLLPHLLYRKTSGHWLVAFLPLLLVLKQLMRPIIGVLEFLESLAHLSEPEEKAEDAPTPAENIEALIDAGAEEGLIEEEDRQLIQSVVEFGDKTVREVMTPRPEIVAIARQASFDELRAMVIREEYSRIPVFEGTIDHVVGFVHVRDVFKQDFAARSKRSIEAVLRPIQYVPETKAVSSMFREMQAEGSHIAMVADEYGNTAGLVTMEDVVEVILGEIRDEHEPNRDFVEDAEGGFTLSGNCDLDRLTDLVGYRATGQPDSATIGGLVTEWLGHVPKPGEVVEQDGLRVEVLASDERRVSQVRVIRAPEPSPADAKETTIEGNGNS
jgi:putative hemolysin